MKKIKEILLIAWAIVTLILAVFTTFFIMSWTNNGFPSIFAHDTEISTVVLEKELEDIGELATEKYYFTEMKNREDTMEFLDLEGWEMPWTSNSIIITFSGYVTAGISDFSKIDIDIDEKDQTIVVELPEVEILGVYIDHDSIDTYDVEDNIFNPIPMDAQVDMLKEAEDEVVDEALNDGILDKSKQRLEDLIESLIETMVEGTSYSGYSIEFKWK